MYCINVGLSRVRIATRNNRRGEIWCQLQEGMTVSHRYTVCATYVYHVQAFLDILLEVPPAVTPSNGTGTAFAYFTVDGQVSLQITVSMINIGVP